VEILALDGSAPSTDGIVLKKAPPSGSAAKAGTIFVYAEF